MTKKELLVASGRAKLQGKPFVNQGQVVAAAWERYVCSAVEEDVLDLRKREAGWGTINDIIRSPVSFWRTDAPYLPTASLQCIHDWERDATRYLWTCKQCGQRVTEFDIANLRTR